MLPVALDAPLHGETHPHTWSTGNAPEFVFCGFARHTHTHTEDFARDVRTYGRKEKSRNVFQNFDNRVGLMLECGRLVEWNSGDSSFTEIRSGLLRPAWNPLDLVSRLEKMMQLWMRVT